ncbi:MAG TPA: polysaccharide pyruvyl transferase CsaB [Bacillota bacterium]|nr:polysaccharide pyruvyl transferase CsaB [Bacillota bacterium]
MPKVVISGYYGFHNSGDEAILHAMLLALRDAVPGLEAVVLSKDPGYTSSEFGVRSILRDKPLDVLKALREADLLISGGGGLLQDVTGPKSIIYYLGVAALAKFLGKPVFFYAQGIGPVNTALGRALVRLVADRVNVITVRDQDSKEELVAMGVTRPRIHVTADPVLGLNPDLFDRERGREILMSLGVGEGPLVGISVRPWKGLEGFKGAVAGAADDLAAEGWQVLLVPMHYPGDLGVCREVASKMKARPHIFDGGAGYRDLLAVTANLDLAVGMRLHFLIFGAIFGVPVLGIPYDPKVNCFLRSLGLPSGLDVETLEHGRLISAVRELLKNREEAGARLKERVGHLRNMALRNASLAAELIGGVPAS